MFRKASVLIIIRILNRIKHKAFKHMMPARILKI